MSDDSENQENQEDEMTYEEKEMWAKLDDNFGALFNLQKLAGIVNKPVTDKKIDEGPEMDKKMSGDFSDEDPEMSAKLADILKNKPADITGTEENVWKTLQDPYYAEMNGRLRDIKRENESREHAELDRLSEMMDDINKELDSIENENPTRKESE